MNFTSSSTGGSLSPFSMSLDWSPYLDDVARLLKVLQRFVDDGNTVLVIEHNLDVY